MKLYNHMIEEFEKHGKLTFSGQYIDKPRFFGAYAIYSIQKAWIEGNKEELSVNFAGEIRRDGMLYRCAGPEVVEQWSRWGPVLDFLGTLGVQLPDLVSIVDNRDFYTDDQEYQWAKEHSTPPVDFVGAVEKQYQQMMPEQRAVTMYLHALHDGVVLFPMVLALGRCTPELYAKGVIAAKALIAGVFADVTKKDETKMFTRFSKDARTALEYIRCYRGGAAVTVPSA